MTFSSSWCAVDQRDRAGGLVDLAALDADQPVLDHVEPADALRAGPRVQLDDRLEHGDRDARRSRPGRRTSKRDDDLVGARAGSAGSCGVGVDVLDRGVPDVLEEAGLDRAPPDVLVDRVRRFFVDVDRQVRAPRRRRWPCPGSCRSRGPARCTVSSGASAPMPTSNRTWSLPLPVQPCATVSAPCFFAAATRCLTMTGRRQRGDQRVAVHVEGVGLERGQAVLVGELGRGRRRPRPPPRRSPARAGGSSRGPRRPGRRRPRRRSPRRRSRSAIQPMHTEVSSPPE